MDSSHLARIYREIEIMKSLDHQNIVKLCQVYKYIQALFLVSLFNTIYNFIFKVMESKNMLYLVCEYASNGEIFGKKKKNLFFL